MRRPAFPSSEMNSTGVLATARRREGPWKSITESSLSSIFSAFC
ncbi:hypothetical protein T02_7100 [Trichinella nativa]|uniref:Uncharacterized protein n=1 Tax=Trichinella nativa TaxID=6335 RepID=A0A0V1KJJ6_9BILA|nr:hypothetical protein T02_7100 [Trichinella nativa]